MVSRCCRWGRGWGGGEDLFVRIATCSLCPTQARPVLSTAQLLQPAKQESSWGKLLARVCMDVRSRAPGRGMVACQSGWEAPGGSACTVKGPYATQMSPGSLVRRGGWGGGEKFAFMRCHPISQHGAAAAALRDDNLCTRPCDPCDP